MYIFRITFQLELLSAWMGLLVNYVSGGERWKRNKPRRRDEFQSPLTKLWQKKSKNRRWLTQTVQLWNCNSIVVYTAFETINVTKNYL